MIKHVSNKIQNAIQTELFRAKDSIKIAVAWFTNELLLQPLLLKLQNGVSVELILNNDEINRGGESSLDFTEFLQAGGLLRWNNSKQLMHDKFCIIDDRIVIAGSYNWTNKAEYNNESITVFYDEKKTVDFFNSNYHKITHNIPYEEGGKVENTDKLAEAQNTIRKHSYDQVSQEGKYSEDYSILFEAPNVREFKISKLTVEIAEQAFSSCKHLETIDLASVCKIGRSAFSKCELLQKIVIPNTVKEIGDFAFSGCTSLQWMSIPNSIEKLGDGAFSGCCSLTTISISNSITSIGSSTFEGCSSLRQIIIPSSVKEIGNSAFKDCSSLQEMVIPDSVTHIGSSAFEGCTLLRQIRVSNSLDAIWSSTFKNCVSLQQILIPDSVKAIGNSAFEGCTSIRKLIIPNSVSLIDTHALFRCSSLNQLIIPDSVKTTSIRKYIDNPTITVPCFVPLTEIIVKHTIIDRSSCKNSKISNDYINIKMTLVEKNNKDHSKHDVEFYNPSSSYPYRPFCSPELYTLNDGEIITIPENPPIFQRQLERYKEYRQGQGLIMYFQKKDENAPKVEYINVVTNTGYIVEFYPSVLWRTLAIEVDENGKYIRENDRIKIHRRTDDITRFIDSLGNKRIDVKNILQALAGCQIKYHFVKCLRIRYKNIAEGDANKNDVGMYIMAEWSFVGDKRPVVLKEKIINQEKISDTSSYTIKDFDALKSKFKYKIDINHK